MKGDVYIGRGCGQRGLKRNPHCNNYKVANYGRQAAIELFEHHLLSSPQLLEELWTLSECRVVCHCRPEQECHGDVIIRQVRLRYPSAHDRNVPLSAAPMTNVLQYMARLRETPESDDGSTADDDAPPDPYWWARSPQTVDSGYSRREYCDGQTLASPGKMASRVSKIPRRPRVEKESHKWSGIFADFWNHGCPCELRDGTCHGVPVPDRSSELVEESRNLSSGRIR